MNRSFRYRLLLRVGLIVGIALLLLISLIWEGAVIWLRIDAERFVREEAEEISSYILRANNEVSIESYHWNEPHHLFDERRIDPLFVQILDSKGRETYATENVNLLPDGTYPHYLVRESLEGFSPFQELDIHFVGPAELYFMSYPIRSSNRELLGYIQIARYLPDFQSTLERVVLAAVGASLLLLLALLTSIYLGAGRLLAPLHTIAGTADAVSADRLDVRIPAFDKVDRESKLVANAFNRLLDRLNASFEDMRRFTSNASHQLQTPLTIVKGHIDVTLRHDRTASDYVETLLLIEKEVDAMTGMVRSLLQLSHLEQDPDGIEMTSVLLSSLVPEAVQRCFESTTHMSLHIQNDVWIRSSSGMSSQLLDVVLDNARKYGLGSPVHVTLVAENSEAVLTIQDEGIGIDAADLHLIRERFFRGARAKNRSISGDGLGLALADRIVAWHKGKLSVQSPYMVDGREKNGTQVSIHIPLLDAPNVVHS